MILDTYEGRQLSLEESPFSQIALLLVRGNIGLFCFQYSKIIIEDEQNRPSKIPATQSFVGESKFIQQDLSYI